MGRRLAVLVTVVLAAMGAGAPASAAPAAPLNQQVSGPFTGTFDWEFGEGCPFVHQVFSGTYATRQGAGAFTIDTCLDGSGNEGLFNLSGTFEVTTPKGSVLRGMVTGTTDAAVPDSSLDLTLRVTQGTKQARRATGSIQVTGTWGAGVLVRTGPTSGAFVGALSGGKHSNP